MDGKIVGQMAVANSQHSEMYGSILEPILLPMADEIAVIANAHGRVQALDLAAGTGLLARAVAPVMKTVVGVDISSGILRRAKERSDGRLPCIVGNAHKLPFESEPSIACCVVSAFPTSRR